MNEVEDADRAARLRELLERQCVGDDPIVVVGMHRSGTTLLAQILSAAGVYTGSRLSGNHEPRLFQDANRQVLDYFGASWCHVDPVPAAEVLWSGFAGLRRTIGDRLVQDLPTMFFDQLRPGQTVWGWKDPRNCLTAPVYARLLPNARAVFIHRHPAPVIRSLRVRDHRLRQKWPASDATWASACPAISDEQAMRLWEIYNRNAVTAIAYFTRSYTLSYENLLRDPVREVSSMFNALGLASNNEFASLAALVRREAASGPLDRAEGESLAQGSPTYSRLYLPGVPAA